MPGIFGVVEGGGQRPVVDDTHPCLALKAMARAMSYESFYTCTLRQFDELGVYAGWVGRPEEAGARGPVVDQGSGVSLFFTGEPYCDASAVADPGDKVVRAYEQSPASFPTSMSGLFSGFIVDEPRGRSLLFTDRLGMERLFIYENEERLIFSSEAKAILAAAPQTRSFDPQGLAEFFSCGCTFGERSLFRGMRVLPAGSVLELERGRVRKARTYFDRAVWEQAEPLPERRFLAELGETLENTVKRHAATPPAIAVSLTGGLDSRMIMASLNVAQGAVPCYTFGSMYRDTYDVRVSRKIAERCGQPHHVLVLGDEFVRNSPAYLEKAVFISDGYMGLSGAAELFLNGQARTVAPVRVTGNYGGELLRGFRAFKGAVPKGNFLLPELARQVDDTNRAFASMTEMKPLSFTFFRQAPAGYGRYALERSQVTVRSPFLDDHLAKLLYRSPAQFSDSIDPSKFLIGRRRPDLLAIATDRGFLGRGGSLGRNMRRAYRELLFKGEYLTGHGAPDRVAAITRSMPGQLLERAFIGRHKFLHPRMWMRGHLGQYTSDVVLAEAERDLGSYVDASAVRILVREHRAGARNYCDEIDKLLTVALTSRVLFRAGAIVEAW